MIQVRIKHTTRRASAAEKAGAAEGLTEAANFLLSASRLLVPLEDGALERSGTASVNRARLTAGVSYDTPYAVRQHEELDYRHAEGRTAKYLEGPAETERPAMLAIIAAELRRALL